MERTAGKLPHAHPHPPTDSTRTSLVSTNRDATSQLSRYAFLNHSADTVTQNLPPAVDDKPLARQRRRRTSPEDQTILEAAYSQDPKPDKAARLELVKRVSLGEKEVQIWFQNRRQTSRRKSRPLLPHEIAQYHMARAGVAPQLYSSDLTASSSPEEDTPHSFEGTSDLDPETGIRKVLSKETAAETNASQFISPASSSSDLPKEQPLPDGKANDKDQAPPGSAKVQTSGFSNQVRHVAYSEGDQGRGHSQSFTKPASPLMHADHDESVSRLRKSSSMIRISLTGDGNAKVVTKDSSSPSPPRASQALPPGPHGHERQRSLGTSNQPSGIPPTRPLQRSSSGRSRDSRVWEFWCDKDARSELEEKAQQDASGSAVGAIGLLRSASGRSILGSIPSKRNAALTRQTVSMKRTKTDTVPRLQKSSTALGRLERMATENDSSLAKLLIKPKHADSAFTVYIPGNESDKENWSPSTAISPDGQSEHSLHYNGTRSAAPPAVTSKNWPEQQAGTVLKRQRASLSQSVSIRHENDREVAEFMGTSRRRSSVSGEEELDCVQGLLSLSQGNWR